MYIVDSARYQILRRGVSLLSDGDLNWKTIKTPWLGHEIRAGSVIPLYYTVAVLLLRTRQLYNIIIVVIIKHIDLGPVDFECARTNVVSRMRFVNLTNKNVSRAITVGSSFNYWQLKIIGQIVRPILIEFVSRNFCTHE